MKTQRRRTVLAVDDDEINLMIIIKNVQDAGYIVHSFDNGEAAWEFMQHHSENIDIALLDKMMPGLNGIELLKRIKSNEAMRHIPVIIQTGDAGVVQMREGLEQGAYYYLTKPFHPEILTAILHSAASECAMREELLQHMASGHAKFIGLLEEGDFTFATHAQASVLAAGISQSAAYPEFVAIGLSEIFTNAIEHGNLEIGYETKRACLLAGRWMEEIEQRFTNPKFATRKVHVRIDKTATGLHLAITDEGQGFDWRHFMYDENAPGRLNEPNGRGIAKAMIMLDELRYVDKGNEVHCMIGLAGEMALPHDKGASVEIRPS